MSNLGFVAVKDLCTLRCFFTLYAYILLTQVRRKIV